MAARPTWKGTLKLSLVTIPIRVFPATDPAATVSFHQLHSVCQSRIQQKKWCPQCDREVDKSEIVRGYEFERGRYVIVDEEDIEKVRPESTRIINLTRFADLESIDPVYVDRPYYLAPDGPVGAEAFAVIREALRGKVGVGKLALYGREYVVAVQPRERGLVMLTLRQASEVRSMEMIDELRHVPAEVKPEELKLARQVVGSFEGPLDLSAFRDEYQAQLRQIIEAKIAGEEIVAPEVPEAPAKVVDLREALRRSLEAVSAGRKKPAKAAAEQRAQVRVTGKKKRA